MILRRLESGDHETVEQLHNGAGYDFKFPPFYTNLIETGCLVLDASGTPLAASVAKRSPEIVLAMRLQFHGWVTLAAHSQHYLGRPLRYAGSQWSATCVQYQASGLD